jgi:carboxyl-terminal processing protease
MHLKRSIVIYGLLIVVLFPFSILGTGCDFIKGKVPSELISKSDTGLPPEFSIVAESWQMLSDTYVDKDKLDAKKLSQGAVKGMLEALDDPYTGYIDPESHKDEMAGFEGKYQGIGAVLGSTEGQLVIVSPFSDSPAERAGLRAGDKILKINDEDASKMLPVEASQKIRGEAGTSVKLLIQHEGETESIEVEIVRAEIPLESVSVEMHGDIAHIRISQFLRPTGGDLRDALKEVIEGGGKGIVLDLRNNPGGTLDGAIDVTSQFLLRGIVADVVDGDGNHASLRVRPGGEATNVPLIVLVNGGSASASEIVAGALQDYGRAKLAGSKTFGKGSVQKVLTLDDGSGLHITAARWFTPNGNPINGVGITPDFQLVTLLCVVKGGDTSDECIFNLILTRAINYLEPINYRGYI